MATPNRMSLLTKVHKVLKKHYKPIVPTERPLLETLLFAACLENATYETADKAYAALSTGFFDWNEVRVTTVKELSELLHMLPDPVRASECAKKTLQGVFESTYSFDIEAMRKLNLGQVTQKLEKIDGITPFAVALATQWALHGHAIPVDRALLEAFRVLGVVTPAEAGAGTVPGLEKAISKSKGIEFGSLAHQFAAELHANPYSPALHKTLLEIAPDAKERLPKRPSKTSKPAAPDPESKRKGAKKDPSRAEPEPRKGEPAKQPSKGEPHKKELAKAEPPKKHAGKPEPVKAEVSKKEPARKEPPNKALSKSVKPALRPLPKKKPHGHASPRKPK